MKSRSFKNEGKMGQKLRCNTGEIYGAFYRDFGSSHGKMCHIFWKIDDY